MWNIDVFIQIHCYSPSVMKFWTSDPQNKKKDPYSLSYRLNHFVGTFRYKFICSTFKINSNYSSTLIFIRGLDEGSGKWSLGSGEGWRGAREGEGWRLRKKPEPRRVIQLVNNLKCIYQCVPPSNFSHFYCILNIMIN